MVQFDETRELMDKMMKVAIFQPSEKRRMLKYEGKNSLNPNLIMDIRHKIFRENACKSAAKSSTLAEAKRLVIEEETKELQLKKEQTLIESELRKFEQNLQKSRPKFHGSYTCNKINIASSDEKDFWETSKIKVQFNFDKDNLTTIGMRILCNKRRNKIAESKVAIVQKKTKHASTENVTVESQDIRQCFTNELEGFGNIKVTIKDKSWSEQQERHFLKSCFEALRKNARNKQRFREIKINVQNIVSQRKLRRCIRVWRTHVENARKNRRDKYAAEADARDSDLRKIETFINAIAETQKELTKNRRAESKDSASKDGKVKKEISSIYKQPFVVEPPAQSRLNAQKEIIHKQRIKLAEQSKLIEELKLKQMQEDITKSDQQTINAAKETLTNCGQHTRRTLIQLMRQAGYRDKSLTTTLRVPSPPRFLARMEARAEARRNRIKLREEARRKRVEEERKQEEAAKRREERERRRLQQEALQEAIRMREEREQQRAHKIERYKKLNAMAEKLYRKNLLRRYIMEPFTMLIETRNNNMKKANDHYEFSLIRKVYVRWKIETERQNQIKVELATSLYNRNLLWYALRRWREIVEEEKRKKQVARDFSDMKLQDKCFQRWKIKTMEYKMERLKNERLALQHYKEKLKIKYLNMWKKYPKIIPDIVESERIKNKWREMVREVVPDFNPRERGVILD